MNINIPQNPIKYVKSCKKPQKRRKQGSTNIIFMKNIFTSLEQEIPALPEESINIVAAVEEDEINVK